MVNFNELINRVKETKEYAKQLSLTNISPEQKIYCYGVMDRYLTHLPKYDNEYMAMIIESILEDGMKGYRLHYDEAIDVCSSLMDMREITEDKDRKKIIDEITDIFVKNEIESFHIDW